MGAKLPLVWSLTCEFCGRGGQLYNIVHPDPACSDWIVCHICRENKLDEFEVDA